MNSLRYQPFDDRFWVVSFAFQLWGTWLGVQPDRSCWRAQPAASPTKVSSWRKYHCPPTRNRFVHPSLISTPLGEGFCTTSGGAGGGGGEGWGGGAWPPPWENAVPSRTSVRAR